MLTLHQPPPAWGLPNISPFCVKLETYLRMTRRPYQVALPSVRLGPKGKVPYIVDGDTVMGDSSLIIDYLVRTYGDPLDGALDARQRALGHAVRGMVEEHLYFAVGTLRWSNPDAWPHLRSAFRPMLPPVIGGLILRGVRRSMAAKARAQGIGRHSRDEILGLVAADLDALDALLVGPYVHGAAATSLDAMLYGFLVQLAYVPWDSAEKRLVHARPRLIEYAERMKAAFWADRSPPA